MKVALVHDYLNQDGGAEKVLKVLQAIFPEAPIHTLIYDEEKLGHIFKPDKVRPSYIQTLPWGKTLYKWFLPLMASAIESFDFSGYDLVISSSSAFAKGVITRPGTKHICYCHTPTRYLWSDTHQYIEELSYNKLIKKIIPYILTRLRLWDRLAAERPDYFLANSQEVQKRIKKYYHRDSDLIHPPVETERFSINSQLGNYYLIGGRLVPYKRYDLAVQAFNKLGIPLKIFGEGPELAKLKKIAKDNIKFVGKVNDEQLSRLYAQCLAFIHPQEEDFGITAVEAMASGRPVIAYASGGALETVIDGVTGKFFDEQSWEALADTIIRFKPEEYNPQAIREHARKFDVEVFKRKIQDYVTEKIKQPRLF
ncbi:MAG: glycosyltransferase [bacterium]